MFVAMNPGRLVLASASPRRQDLLRQCGVVFDVLPASVAECDHEHFTAAEVCLLNAHRKARVVAKRHPDRLVLAADTLVALGTRRFGKPADRTEAFRMLTELAGRAHEVVTGVCLLELRHHRERLFAETTVVTFRPLEERQIHAYLSLINPLDKAGAYGIQDRGELIVSEIRGSYTNVVGLPVERLLDELRAWGLER
jgi:septum formation protein